MAACQAHCRSCRGRWRKPGRPRGTRLKLLYQTHSPFARKVLVAILELGVAGIEVEHHETGPTRPDRLVSAANPLGQVPVLLLDNGEPLYDSRVICAYLGGLAAGSRLYPSEPMARLRDMRLEALAGGMCETGIAIRWETERRPEALRYAKLRDGQTAKLAAACDFLERDGPEAAEPTIGTIALATALDWLEFRRLTRLHETHPRLYDWLALFRQRPSMQATVYEGATQD